MGRASRGKEHSDWQLLCKIAELAEPAKHPHMHGFRRQAILGVALATAGCRGGVSPCKIPCPCLGEALGAGGDGAEAGLACLGGEIETEGVATGSEFARCLTFRNAIPCLKFQHMRLVQPQLTTASTCGTQRQLRFTRNLQPTANRKPKGTRLRHLAKDSRPIRGQPACLRNERSEIRHPRPRLRTLTIEANLMRRQRPLQW